MVPYTMTTSVNFLKKMGLKDQIGEGGSSGGLLVSHEEEMFVSITGGKENLIRRN
jgi:hypothetical protein